MQDAGCSLSFHGNFACPESSNFFPQITPIDADTITTSLGIYLRYLRHLRANWDEWVDLSELT